MYEWVIDRRAEMVQVYATNANNNTPDEVLHIIICWLKSPDLPDGVVP